MDKPYFALSGTLLSEDFIRHMWQQDPISKLLVQVLVPRCAAGGELLAGHCVKGHTRDKSGTETWRQLIRSDLWA